MIAASKVENDVNDPETIEVLATFRGLQICANMDIYNTILESDCLLMVKELQDAIYSHSSILGNYMKKIKRLK